MTATPVTATGMAGFMAGLASQGIAAQQNGGLVVYTVEPLVGMYAGKAVQTAVAVSELEGWPLTPPHFVHLPNEVKLDGPQASDVAGWSKYSRPHRGRLDASAHPTRDWVAHIRELLGRAK